MWVVAESDNTIACMFYEKMGGIRKTDTDPGVSVYVWKDITLVRLVYELPCGGT